MLAAALLVLAVSTETSTAASLPVGWRAPAVTPVAWWPGSVHAHNSSLDRLPIVTSTAWPGYAHSSSLDLPIVTSTAVKNVVVWGFLKTLVLDMSRPSRELLPRLAALPRMRASSPRDANRHSTSLAYSPTR